jgi:hypothetical protein
VVVHPRFVNAKGEDATASGRVEEQEVEVTLVNVGDQWLIFDSMIVAARPVGRG